MERINYGLWGLGDSKGFHESIDPRSAKNRIKDAWRSGTRGFDTAFSYNTDSLLYSALKEIGVRTDEAGIIEKIMPVPTLRKKAEASLRALKTERVEYMLLHWPTEDGMLFEALKTLEKLMDEGKTEHMGVSNFPIALIEKIRHDFPIELHERAFSPVWVKDIEKETVPTLLYGIFGFGTLYHKERPADARGNMYMYSSQKEWNALLDTLGDIERKTGAARAEILSSFALSYGDAIITGTVGNEWRSSSFSLQDEDRRKIMLRASELNKKSESDNIFGHNWRLS